jgi:hypothetical protein
VRVRARKPIAPRCPAADDQLGGNDRADAGLVEEPGCERPNGGKDLDLELCGFLGRRLDGAGEGAKHERRGELVRGAAAGAAQETATLDQPFEGQTRSALPGRIVRKGTPRGGQSPDESQAAARQPGWQNPQTDQPTPPHPVSQSPEV